MNIKNNKSFSRKMILNSALLIGVSITILPEQAVAGSNENLKESNSALPTSVLSSREVRLELFDLDKFDKSFDLKGKVSDQMKTRSAIWSKSSYQEYAKKEVLAYPPNQKKLISYIPYYLSQILEIKSASDLSSKEELFRDFTNLMNATYQSLRPERLKELNRELDKINWEEYELFPIFLRSFAFHIKDNFPDNTIGKASKSIKLEFEGRDLKYHKNLGEKFSKDKEILTLFSKESDFTVIYLKKLFAFYKFID